MRRPGAKLDSQQEEIVASSDRGTTSRSYNEVIAQGAGVFARMLARSRYAPGNDSPALTGTPTAPTAAADTNTTQIASTAFVVGQAGSSTPNMDGTGAAGSSLRYARQDHTHPTDTSRAASGHNHDGTYAKLVSVPSTATSSGSVGDYAADSSYLYICTATNTWRRVAIASW